MSTLRTALRDYLSLQRGLGYTYVHQERTLTSFTCCIGAAPRASASTVDIPLSVWALGGHGPTNWRGTGAEA